MFFSLRNRMFVIFTLILTVPFLVLSIIIPSWFTTIIEDETISSTEDMMDQYSFYIDAITVQAEDLGKQVLVNQSTQQWLKFEKKNVDANNPDRYLLRNELRKQLNSMVLNNSHTMSVSIFLNDGTGIWGDHPLLEETEWFKDFSNHDQRWVKAHTDSYGHNDLDVINSFLIPLFDMNTLDLSGVIKVNFPSLLLKTALGKIKLGETGRAHLLTRLGENVLSGQIETPQYVLEHSLTQINESNQSKGLIETVYDGEEYYVFFQKLTVGDWVLFTEITKSELFFKVDQIQKRLLMTSGIIFILTLIAAYLLSTNIVGPLGKLAKALGFLERGEFSEAKGLMPSIKSDNHEVSYLIKVFHQTIDRLNHLIKIEYEANLRRKDAEYKALLLQINPHFLNNTLEIIGGLAAQGKNKDVINVSVYLGRMMRYSLDTHSDEVKLGEEINYIRNFTDILKLRYEDSISIEIEEDLETKHVQIIKFVIQPLVENAVKYSFIENTFAKIKIRTEKCGNKILIIVEDNGMGMSSEVISELMNVDIDNETNDVLASKGTSIGLKNVLGRLKLYYGQNFSFNIDSEKNRGTKITLCIKTGGAIHDEGINYRR
ncbi:histidine kinase [Anaerobacillus sp. CMMVII]|uniref:cache domain-containing sensor histidine kinase n=1 Tax=Anaerobacillus sp. CMMVII TaxID=2755588 RepID=UPI0021B7EA7E|nr:sensor histidine kinase [Anaerobacillus sp. CMMVII]MCT8139383.1 histidine kinase [Anaerobacillus sp. CMMVII]